MTESRRSQGKKTKGGKQRRAKRRTWFRQFHMVVFPGSARAGIGGERIHIRRLNMAQINGGG